MPRWMAWPHRWNRNSASRVVALPPSLLISLARIPASSAIIGPSGANNAKDIGKARTTIRANAERNDIRHSGEAIHLRNLSAA